MADDWTAQADDYRRRDIIEIGDNVKALGRLMALLKHDDDAAAVCARARKLLMRTYPWRNAYKVPHVG